MHPFLKSVLLVGNDLSTAFKDSRVCNKVLIAFLGLSVLLPFLALVGWLYNVPFLRSGIAGLTAMNPLTAICLFILTSCILMLTKRKPKQFQIITRVFAALIITISAVRISNYFLGTDLALDNVLFTDKLNLEPIPNRIAPNTAAAFLFMGTAIFLMTFKKRAAIHLSQVFLLLTFFISLLSLIGYLYNISIITRIYSFIPMALNTALVFLFLSVHGLLIFPKSGMMRIITNYQLSGTITRRLLVYAFLLPAIVVFIIYQLQLNGLINLELSVAFMACSTIVLFAVLAWFSGAEIEKIDSKRRLAEEQREMLLKESNLANVILEEIVLERTKELEQTQLEVVERLVRALEYRDDETGYHIDRMSQYCAAIAKEYGFTESECRLIMHASAMHDIGKIAIPDRILHKQGTLTEEEWDEMRKHTITGAKLLEGGNSMLIQVAGDIALNHHERWDGSGYPNKKKGEEIPVVARITSVADVFDALTSERPYKKAWTIEEAAQEIYEQKGKMFDPQVVDAFKRALPSIRIIKQQYQDEAKKAA